MSLPPILRHVYNHGTEEVIRRGKKIFYTSGVQMLDVDHLLEQIRFRVRNDQYQNYYTVTITKYLQAKDLAVRCQCPYNLGEICRHEVAALFQLNDILQSGFFENVNITYDQKHTVVRMRQVSRQLLQLFTSAESLLKAESLSNGLKVHIVVNKNGNIEANVSEAEGNFHVTIRQKEDRYFDTSCTCYEDTHPLCMHKAALFLHVLKTHGPQHFQSMQNWDVQKNKLLEQYGYSLKDDLTGKFEFIYQDNKPFLRVLDSSIKKVNTNVSSIPVQTAVSVAQPVEIEEKRLGVIFDTSVSTFPYIDVILVVGTFNDAKTGFSGPIEKLELSQYVNPMRFVAEDRELLPVIRKFQPEEILRYLKKTLPFGDFLHDYDSVLKDIPQDDVRMQAWEYLVPKYRKLAEKHHTHTLFYLKQNGKTLSSHSIDSFTISPQPIHPQLIVRKENSGALIELEWNIENRAVTFGDALLLNPAIVLFDNCLSVVADLQEVAIVEKFAKDGTMKISERDWNDFLTNDLMKWSSFMHVHFDEELTEHVQEFAPVWRLYLSERDQTLIMQPALAYNNTEIKPSYFGDVIQPRNGVISIIKRSEKSESEFVELLQNLHTDIVYNKKEDTLYLSGSAVLSNNWFFRFADLMRENNVELLGLEGLRSLRVNTHKPQTQIQVSSGIDWFDASIQLTFGDQQVSITEVKKALSQRQNFVRLGDGSLGLLPGEWLKKYSLLLKMGESKGNKLRLKRFHFNILQELLSEIDEEELLRELEEKKERLSKILDNDFSNVNPPEKLSATLRPYQLAGFQWLIFLNEAGWGGILADDMGLGKTVQTLSFFQYYKNLNPKAIFLVVCPTTLMYNWENEIKKFTPEMTHVIHHGPKRNPTPATYIGCDIIITTYGTMRSDIKSLRDIEFDYVVLDESQSIKNPQSQVARASLLINSKNRLALSGTPVQNNTFDLYAQMNFLNPGMLGSREFFMSEFATPIDKFMEDEVKQQLRKLTYPFLLRRTKEQVAKDLPEKTETILYCEMGTEQRRIYDAYRNTYRSQILGLIEEQGMERSQMHILQGLTRLRQICDSPAILNESEKYQNHSVKLDELSREITENVGNHKVLVFSQFLGMLALIRQKLTSENIKHVYFDGSSSSTEREKAIHEFQNNEDCRVFLISLKAGGIGLNLTAADYVYIVDPWWNPAVEQQAIDRTHRIGQTKNIFAYRLICKDTLEEKMLLLQERKRALAADLVSDDNAFMKRLTRDDIAFLFS